MSCFFLSECKNVKNVPLILSIKEALEEKGDVTESIRSWKNNVDKSKVLIDSGMYFDCELFLCDIETAHCTFINNMTIALDNNFDCFHQYIKIYVNLRDKCRREDNYHYAFIPNYIENQKKKLIEVVEEQSVSTTCQEILK